MTDTAPQPEIPVPSEPDPPADEVTVTDEPAPVPEAPPVATQVIPTQFFHDSREVTAAENAGLASPAGQPLAPAAREKLSELHKALSGIEAWIAHARGVMGAVEAIGHGQP